MPGELHARAHRAAGVLTERRGQLVRSDGSREHPGRRVDHHLPDLDRQLRGVAPGTGHQAQPHRSDLVAAPPAGDEPPADGGRPGAGATAGVALVGRRRVRGQHESRVHPLDTLGRDVELDDHLVALDAARGSDPGAHRGRPRQPGAWRDGEHHQRRHRHDEQLAVRRRDGPDDGQRGDQDQPAQPGGRREAQPDGSHRRVVIAGPAPSRGRRRPRRRRSRGAPRARGAG